MTCSPSDGTKTLSIAKRLAKKKWIEQSFHWVSFLFQFLGSFHFVHLRTICFLPFWYWHLLGSTALSSTQEIQPCGASSSNLRLGHSAWMVGPHTLCLPKWKAGNMTWYTWYTPECNKWNIMQPKSWRFGKWCPVSFPCWFWGSMFATHQLNWMTPKSRVNSYYMLIDLIPKSW